MRVQHIAAPLLPVAASLIVGIAVGYHCDMDERWLMACGVGLLLITLLCRRHPSLQTVGIMLITATIGMLLSTHQVRQLRTSWSPGLHWRELIVASEPRAQGKTLVMDVLTSDGRKLQCRLMADERSRKLHIGHGFAAKGEIEPFPTNRLAYYDSHGYSGQIFGGSNWQPKRVSLDGLSLLWRAKLRMLRWRDRLLQRYREHGIDADAYAMIAAMTLGSKTQLSKELQETFSTTGASHILALSGLHLSIIYMLLSVLSMGRRWRVVTQTVTILAIWVYALLTGMAPSVVRAAGMLTVYGLLTIGHRQKASLNVLCFTVIVTLVISPLALFDVGFQLSYTAVASILIFHPLFTGMLFSPQWLQQHRVVNGLWNILSISIAAQIGTTPLVVYYFHRLSTCALISNFIVIPCAYIILVGGLLLLFTQLSVVAVAIQSTANLMQQSLEGIAALPYSSIEPLHPTLLQTALLYLAIASLYVACTARRTKFSF